jgi:type IV pilus assembly protein PilY1
MMRNARLPGGGNRLGTAFALVAIALLAAPAACWAQDCELPLFVQQYHADANVMFLIDNSGSMNEALLHPAYDSEAVYDGPFNPDAEYYVAKDGWYELSDFNAGWSIYGNQQAYLINSDNGEDGRYWGNYLNWVYLHATEAQRLDIPRLTRIQVTKLVLSDIVQRSSARIRFGITVFHLYGPGNIIGICGSNTQSLLSQIAGITANKWTPTGESMETVLDYFSSDAPNAPIQAYCQKNFLVIMTDGFPTMDRDVSAYLWDADGDGNDPGSCASIGAPYEEWQECSDFMDDVAYYMYNTDLRPDLGDPGESGPDGQNVVTYVIGFKVDGGLLRETAANGGGEYFHAENGAELIYAFRLVMQDIIMRISSGSAVAVVSTERGDEDHMIRGKFMPGTWEGFLESYAIPHQEGDGPIWESGHLLADRSAGSRDIFTALGSTPLPFQASSAGALMGPMGLADAGTAGDVISWTRGENVPGYRPRGEWKLGDIVSSTPVIVGPPSSFVTDPAYQAFTEAYAEREKVIYVGANDGMIHCFGIETGEERWAFVPESSLPKLAAVADSFYCHTYTCDQTVTVTDAKLNGTWRTVLATGQRQGGAGYCALDVTDPANPQVLWQEVLPDGHGFSSEVEIGNIGGQPIAFIGSGLDGDNGLGYLYAYSLRTGQLLGSRLLSDTRDRNKVTRPRAVDIDYDGNSDVLYCGDMAGNLWRAEFNGSTNPSSWNWSLLFTCRQAITANPTVAYGENNRLNVYFGTGTYLSEDDFGTTNGNQFFCVYDTHDGGTYDPGDLVDQTSTIQDVGNAHGWFIDLWHDPGERVTEQAVVVARTVFFTSFTPVVDVCESGGRSWLYRMSYDDGGQPDIEGEDNPSRDVELGEGVAARPVVDLANESVIVQSSDASIETVPIGVNFLRMTVRSWQENFDSVGAAAVGQ